MCVFYGLLIVVALFCCLYIRLLFSPRLAGFECIPILLELQTVRPDYLNNVRLVCISELLLG
jgi:hypothetical protein